MHLIDHKKFDVTSFPVQHSIPCVGFRFEEKEKPIRLNREIIPDDLSLQEIATLKKGEDVIREASGETFSSHALTLPPKKSRSYAFTADTAYYEPMLPHIENVDLLYHEATFMEDQLERAWNTQHATAAQAGIIARKAGAARLLIGHFSIRYKDLAPVLEEARTEFPEAELALEGRVYEVPD